MAFESMASLVALLRCLLTKPDSHPGNYTSLTDTTLRRDLVSTLIQPSERIVLPQLPERKPIQPH